MKLIMAGIDYTTAPVEVREQFVLPTTRAAWLLHEVKSYPSILGCVLLSTCNRTELYLSCDNEEPDAATLLCSLLELPEYEKYFARRRERAVVSHLMLTATGLRSQILGEDQILTQVRMALEAARAQGCADPVLETLFRNAITAGKRTRAQVRLSQTGTSVAGRAIERLQQEIGSLGGRCALVIGNGEMGRLSAGLLREAGCKVMVTLRSYKRGAIRVPTGCEGVPYDLRYEMLQRCDLVVSATTSPHHTLQARQLMACARLPRYFVDLAVPRDIDPGVEQIQEVTCWNMDTLSVGGTALPQRERILEILSMIQEYRTRFDHWCDYRGSLATTKKEQRA